MSETGGLSGEERFEIENAIRQSPNSAYLVLPGPVDITYTFLPKVVAAVERILAAREDANAEVVARVEALADEWADDTGIEGYINLGEVESRLRRALHPDPSDA